MREQVVRHYLKEEEFLDKHHMSASEAAAMLSGAWHPNSRCNDSVRHNRDYFYSTGQLETLVFDSASVYHDDDGRFSSVQIVLKSSTRGVTVRVRRVGDDLEAEVIRDEVRVPPTKP